MRGGDQHEFEAISIGGATLKTIKLDRYYVIDSFTPDFSGFAFTDATKLPEWKHEYRHLVKLQGIPQFEVCRRVRDSITFGGTAYSIVWMSFDGSSFVTFCEGELSYFSRSKSSFNRSTISKNARSFAVFNKDIYYSDANSPGTLRRLSIDNANTREIVYQSSEALDYIVIAGLRAEFLVACRSPLQNSGYECQSVDLRTHQSRPLPKPQEEHISRITPLKGTAKVVLLTSRGREWIGGSIAELHLVDLVRGEHSWVYDIYRNYSMHRLYPSYSAVN